MAAWLRQENRFGEHYRGKDGPRLRAGINTKSISQNFNRCILNNRKKPTAERRTISAAPPLITTITNACDVGQQVLSELFRFLHSWCGKCLTTFLSGLKYRSILICPRLRASPMNFIQPANSTYIYPKGEAMEKKCLHPRVQVVSRDEDAEFVECLECREIFESSEFRDMDIEAKIPTEEE